MALEGSLRDFGLADILQLIYFQKKTGILALSGELDRIRIMFYEGNVVSAESRKRVEENRFGKILLKRGVIREEDLRASLEEQKTTGIRLGDLLLKNGLVKKEDIRDTLISQMTETVVQLFSWKEGTYEFQGQQVALSQDIPITLDTQHLLMEGLRVLDEWSLVEGKITLDTIFAKTGKTEASLTDAEESILNFVDGENDVSIIIGLSGVDDFEASKVLVSLMEREIIEPVTVSSVVAEAVSVLPEAKERAFLRALYPVIFILVIVFSVMAASFQETWSHKGIAAFWYGDSLKRAVTLKNIDGLRFMAEAFRFRNGSYPASLVQIGDARDAWGRPYFYSVENGSVIIVSAGQDGKMGTADDIY
jgi:hypothetical protein